MHPRQLRRFMYFTIRIRDSVADMPYSACAYDNSQFCYNYRKITVNHNLQTMNDIANYDTCIVMTKGPSH